MAIEAVRPEASAGYEPPEVVDIDAADDRELGVVPAVQIGSEVNG